MHDRGPQFIIFGDVLKGYWWRLRSPKGETLQSSGRMLRHKAECEWEVYRLKDERYPSAEVRDATIG
jgi:hypothetical protein